MKKLITIFVVLISMLSANAQSLNWNTNVQGKSFVYASTGFDFGFTNTLGYAHHLNTKKPILLNADFSMPLGEQLFDDYKIRLGGQMLLVERNNLMLVTKLSGIYKTHETSLVKMSSVGLEAGMVLGYYKSGWHVAGEFGYDHSLATRLKNSDSIVENFPEITDGWYANTGGNFYTGFQFGKTLGEKMEINLRVGKFAAKFDDTNPLIPFYGLVGLLYKIGHDEI